MFINKPKFAARMRVTIQRVSEASVTINGKIKSAIGKGLLVLAGFEEADTPEDLEWMSHKIINLRIFEDENQQMNLSVKDVNGDMIIVSQFTLFALTKKGNRPSFIYAAKPAVAISLYQKFIVMTETLLGKKIGSGEFGADMKVALINDGPVTININSKQKE